MSRLFEDTEDDVSLNTRRSAMHDVDGRSVADMHDPAHDREVTLNTGTVLVLFFALALVCAVFFGFGYSMGRKSALPATAPTESAGSAGSTPISDGAAVPPVSTKPAPGSPAIQAIPGYLSQSEANEANEKAGARTVAATKAPDVEKPAPVTRPPAVETPKPAVKTPAPAAAPVYTPPATAAAPATTAPYVAGATYVQIAAVSHQEDADVLMSALRRRGYKVLQRNEPADRLIHVQIGPFTNRKDADATRQKLLSDGYNAFLK